MRATFHARFCMYPELLPFLRCPACRAALLLQRPASDGTGALVAGRLACQGCRACYPLRAGIADFLGAPRPATPAQLANEWPPTAWGYERLWRPFALTLLSGQRFPYRRELPLVAGMAAAARGGLFVDLACSNGLYARALTRAFGPAGGHVVGVDHALPMLLEARRRALERGLRISYVRAEAQALPLATAAASGVAVGGSLNEIGDLAGCLAEARRVLLPRGRLATMSLVRASSSWGRTIQAAVAPAGVAFCATDELLARFAQHRLHTLGTEQYGIVLFAAAEAVPG